MDSELIATDLVYYISEHEVVDYDTDAVKYVYENVVCGTPDDELWEVVLDGWELGYLDASDVATWLNGACHQRRE